MGKTRYTGDLVDGIRVNAPTGEVTIAQLATNDSTLFIQPDSTGKLVLAAPAGGGSETWQQTLDNGSVLNKDNTIDGGNFAFFMQNAISFRVESGGNGNITFSDVYKYSNLYNSNLDNSIQAEYYQDVSTGGGIDSKGMAGFDVWDGSNDTGVYANTENVFAFGRHIKLLDQYSDMNLLTNIYQPTTADLTGFEPIVINTATGELSRYSGSLGAADRFGIEDNTGVQDRAVDMQDKHLFISNANAFDFSLSDTKYGFGICQGGDCGFYAYAGVNDDSDNWQLNVNPTYVNLVETLSGSIVKKLQFPSLSGQVDDVFYSPISISVNAGSKVFADSAGNIDITVAGGGSQGLQDVITVDPVLTGNNTIDGGGFDLTLNNNNNVVINASNDLLLGGFGAGTITGTGTFALLVDSTGKVIEGAIVGAGGATASNGLSIDGGSGDVILGGTLTASTTIDGVDSTKDLTFTNLDEFIVNTDNTVTLNTTNATYRTTVLSEGYDMFLSMGTVDGTTSTGYILLDPTVNAIELYVTEPTSGSRDYCQISMGPNVGATDTDAINMICADADGTVSSINITQSNASVTTPGTFVVATGTGSSNIGGTPNAAAALQVDSTTKGFLFPRMTKTQRNAISSPPAGLGVYQTDNTPGLRVYNGTHWVKYTETNDD